MLATLIPPVNFPVIGTVGQAGKMNITYLDQWVGFSQRPSLTLPTPAITGKFTGPILTEQTHSGKLL